MWQDVRLAGRSLARRVGWTAAGVLTLAIGIAGSTLVISLLDQALLRPLRFNDGDRLVTLYVTSASQFSPLPYPDYTRFRTALDDTLDLAAFCRVFMTVGGGTAAARHQGEMVSGNFFSVLDIQPALGRVIGPADNIVPGGPRIVVLSDFLWRSQFSSDPEIVGAQLRLNNDMYDVVGVAPPGFRGAVYPGFQTAFWIPAMMANEYFSDRDVLDTRSISVFQTVGRLAPGARIEGVQARIDPLDEVLSENRVTDLYFTDTGAPWRVRVLPGNYLRLWPEYRDAVAAFLRLLGFMAVALLAVACANVATLLLARSIEWRKELALRLALGASRFDLARRLGAEVALLLVAGGFGAIALVLWLSPLAPQLPLTVTYGLDLTPDARVLAIGLVVALATGSAFAVPPIWSTLRDPLSLATVSRTMSAGRSPVMDALVIAQVALAVILVTGCGLLVRSAWNTQQIDPGFHAPFGASARVTFPEGLEGDTRARSTFTARLLESLRLEGVVASASAAAWQPLSMSGRVEVRFGDSLAVDPETPVDTSFHRITADHFDTFDIPLYAGRVFTLTEALRGAPVAVVSRALATLHWADRDPVGRTLRLEPEAEPRRIIGVVGDVVARDIRLAPTPAVYLSLRPDEERAAFVTIRLRGDDTGGERLLREHVARLDSTVLVAGPTTFAGMRRDATRESRIQAELAGLLAAVALALALVGLYGLMGYLVHRREREMGIRTALGATPTTIVTLVVGRGCRLTLLGVTLGLAASVATNRLLTRLLYDVDSTDPLTLVFVPVLIVAAAVIACWGPARRAARVDPTDALRAE